MEQGDKLKYNADYAHNDFYNKKYKNYRPL